MNIELKNIMYYESFGEETLAFNAIYTLKESEQELPKMMAAKQYLLHRW